MKTLLLVKNYFTFNGVISSLMSALKLSFIGATLLAVPGYAYYVHTKLQNMELEQLKQKTIYENVYIQKENCDSIKKILLKENLMLKDSIYTIRTGKHRKAVKAVKTIKYVKPVKSSKVEHDSDWYTTKPTTDINHHIGW